MADMDLLNSHLDPTNSASLLLNEQNMLKERLLEEERKNFHLQQCIQQIKQQHSSLMTSIGNLSNNKAQNDSYNINQNNFSTSSVADFNMPFDSSHSNLLIEANTKETRMKQLEIQVQQLQDELNATKNSMQHRSSNENFNSETIGNTNPASMANSAIQSTHVSPQPVSASSNTNNNNTTNSSHLPASASNLATQVELLKTNERFLKEKVIGKKNMK